MKHKELFKLSLIVALTLFCGISIKAQTWTAPTLTGSTPVTGTTYYMYNVGSNGYLNRGGWWSMQSVLSAQPRANASTSIVKWTATNTAGSTWTFQYNLAGSNVNNNYLFAADANSADGSVFTDNSSNNTWNVVQTDAVNNIYSIQVVSSYGGYVPTQYLGTASTTESTNSGTANVVRYNRASGDSYTQWKFVSQADYDLYLAKVVLDRYMRYAKAGGTIDLTTYIATYNSDVTADIISNAATLLTALNRTAVTVTNYSFESALGSEWTNTGSFVRQGNDPGQGWTKDASNYCEKYTGSGGYLGTGSLTQTVSVPNGLYGLVASGHAVQQAGANPLNSGAFIFAGSKTAEVTAGQDYFVDSVSVTNGSIAIGYSLTGTVQVNWTGFDNFKLYRYVTYTTPALSASVTSLRFDDIYASASITISGSNLTSDVAITVPAGITLSGANITSNGGGSYTIAAANANSTNTATVTYDGSSVVNGTISMSGTGSGSQSATSSFAVKASSNASCYTPLYPSGNMIADPTFSALTLADGGFSGWGPTSIDTKNPYCGRGSAFIRGTCYPDGGSLNRDLTTANGNALKANKQYRLRAMINSQASAGTSFQFQIEGFNGSTSKFFLIPNSNGWVQFDETFTTGATVTEHGIYFNSCVDGSRPAITDTCFIDNWELYEVPSIPTGLAPVGLVNQNVYVQDKQVVADFNLASAKKVEFDVYNTQGMLIAKQVGFYSEGNNHVVLNSNLTSGVYIVKTSIGGRFIINKIVF